MTKNKLFFILILVFSIFFRFYRLDNLPPSLNWDEISHGYNAYSLLKTGQDQWGSRWPVFNFRAYGDYPTTLNLYLTMPFIAIFGLNALSIRLPAAIISFLFTIIVYFFVRLVTNNRHLSLFAFALASFSPWVFFPARAVFQSNLSQFFLILGIYLFLKSKTSQKLLNLSAIAFGLSMYSYHNTRLVTPLIVFLLYFLFKKYFTKKFFLLFLLFALPNLINLFSPESLARNRWVGIINPTTINLINENRRLFEGPQFLNLIINNKATFFIKEFGHNLLNFFNPVPLFFSGSQNYQFNPPQTGLIFPIFLPFFYLGLIICFKNLKNRLYLFCLLAFQISLLPAALTMGDFPSIRLTIATPFYFLFISLGFLPFIRLTRGYLTPLFLIILFTFFFRYFHQYLQYTQDFAASWQYGYQTLISKLKPLYPQYESIYITKKYGEPHQFILFYWPWDPQSYLKDPHKNTDFHSDWYWVNSFDKFVFVNDWEIQNQSFPPNSLLVTSPQNYPQSNSKLLTTINFPNSKPVFEIIAYE